MDRTRTRWYAERTERRFVLNLIVTLTFAAQLSTDLGSLG